MPAQQQLVTLLCDAYDNAPNSARLALARFDGLFRPGDPVQFYPSGIAIGDALWIDRHRCHCWQPPQHNISAGQFRYIPWQRWRDIIHQQLQENDTLFFWQGDNPFYQAIADELRQRREILFNALRNGENITQAVSNMIGLGIGLTPSGDDYLVGLSAILFIRGHPGEKYRAAFYSALQAGRQNTTALSAITLQAALERRYRENMTEFITCIVTGSERFSIQAIANIKRIGSSSGCDMLYGMADACALSQLYGENDVS